MKQVFIVLAAVLSGLSTVAMAHEGHGSGAGHDLYHTVLTLFIVAVPVAAVLWWQRRKS